LGAAALDANLQPGALAAQHFELGALIELLSTRRRPGGRNAQQRIRHGESLPGGFAQGCVGAGPAARGGAGTARSGSAGGHEQVLAQALAGVPVHRYPGIGLIALDGLPGAFAVRAVNRPGPVAELGQHALNVHDQLFERSRGLPGRAGSRLSDCQVSETTQSNKQQGNEQYTLGHSRSRHSSTVLAKRAD
jgi:hypothetical protein